MVWVYYTLMVIFQVAGLIVTLIGLPGLWLMVGALILFGVVTGWTQHIGWQATIAMLVLATLAEVVEFLAGAAGSKQAGASKRGMAGAIVGGLVGAIVFTPLIPIPIVGTIAGMCIGSFGGAFAVEMLIGKKVQQSAAVGWGAAKGRFWGTVLKLVFGVIMFLVAAICALPI